MILNNQNDVKVFLQTKKLLQLFSRNELILNLCVLVKITCDSEWELKNIDWNNDVFDFFFVECNISICFLLFFVFFPPIFSKKLLYTLKVVQTNIIICKWKSWFSWTYSDFWLVSTPTPKNNNKKEVWLHIKNTMMYTRLQQDWLF